STIQLRKHVGSGSACVQDVHRGYALPENDSGCAPTARLSAESSDIYSRSTPPSNFEIGSRHPVLHLRWQDLRCVDLRCVDLRGVDLRGVALRLALLPYLCKLRSEDRRIEGHGPALVSCDRAQSNLYLTE